VKGLPLLQRFSWRHAARHPWQVALAVLGIALGVAVVTAIDLTGASARRAMDLATDSVVGRTTHQIVGGSQGVAEQHYVALRRSGVVDAIAPVIDAGVRLSGNEGGRLRILGVDPVAEAPFRNFAGLSSDGPDALALMSEPGAVWLSAPAAGRLAVGPGETVAVSAQGRSFDLNVQAVLDGAAQAAALRGIELAVMDIASAQELLGMAGRLSRMDLVLSADRVAAVAAMLPPGLALVEAQSQREAQSRLTRAFQTNLQALSLMALLVGLFLIYNSQTFLVVQRRAQFGMLRALGVSRRQLATLVLTEAAILGAVGAVLGLAIGYTLAQVLLGLVIRTINDLYFTLSVGTVALDGMLLSKAAVLGILGSLAAALWPAREAARVSPRTALSRADLEVRAGRGAGTALWAGLALIAAGGVLLGLDLGGLPAAFAGLFLVVLGMAALMPAALVGVSRSAARIALVRRSPGMRLAFQGVEAALSRTGVAAAALMVAVATTVGVGVMVTSFRASVADWLDSFLRADYYVSVAGQAVEGAEPVLDIAVVRRLAALPDVRHVSHVRQVDLLGPRGEEPVAVFGLNPEARGGFRFLAKEDGGDLWQRFENRDTVFVTESYAYHHALDVGDGLSLRTPNGLVEFAVLAVYRDYGSDRGHLTLSRSTYDRHWRDPGVTGIGIYTGTGFDLRTLRAALAELVGEDAELDLVSSTRVRQASLEVFDRTFTITQVLRWLAGIIAFIGVLGALLAIQLERTRELGVLKAVGVTAGQLRAIVLGETALVGGVAGLLAAPAGLVIAGLLVHVINRRSFGWSMALDIDVSILAGGFLMGLTAALLAGIYPAARMARIQPAEALRTE